MEEYHERHASIAGKGLKSPVQTSHSTDLIRKKKNRREICTRSRPVSHDKTRTLPNTRHNSKDSNRNGYRESTKQTQSRQPRERYHRRRANEDIRGRSQRHDQQARKKREDTTLQERPQNH